MAPSQAPAAVQCRTMDGPERRRAQGQLGKTITRGRGNDAQAKEERRKQPGRTPATFMQDQFYRKGHAKAYSTEWRSQAETRGHLRHGEGPCFSHHDSGAPWPGVRKLFRGCGFALRTITDNAQHAQQWAGGCGSAAPGDIQDNPPYRYRPGRRAERGRRGYAPQEGGGGLS